MKFIDNTDFFEKWKLGRTPIKSLIEPDILIPIQRKCGESIDYHGELFTT